VRKQKLELCRTLLAVSTPARDHADSPFDHPHFDRCPICNLGRMVVIELLSPAPAAILDTS
jgi:hypothetical protein